jgi:hypothetical protein
VRSARGSATKQPVASPTLTIVGSWPVRDDASLLGTVAKIHSQIGAGQLTSGIDVIGYTVSAWPIDVYPSWPSKNLASATRVQMHARAECRMQEQAQVWKGLL